eukprot:UC1_evm1s1277
MCEIVSAVGPDGRTVPLFIISSDSGLRVVAPSPDAAWRAVYGTVQQSWSTLGALGTPPKGRYMFGLSLAPVISVLERLPGAGRCRGYLFKYERPLPEDFRFRVLPLNKTGSARSEGFSKQRTHSLGTAASVMEA